ncbi:MAG: cation-translocating P-type ATPase [Pseudomonadota bacterium]
MAATPWHRFTAEACAQHLQSSLAGLSSAEAAARLQQYGPNQLQEAPARPWWRLLLSQLSDFMILVLLSAALAAGWIGEWLDAIAIIAIVLLNAIIGVVQEYRAERAVRSLRQLVAVQAKVYRDGRLQTLASARLVPGDRVLLESGDAVPADLRLWQAAHLRIDESTLTGESVPVDKTTEALERDNGSEIALADRHNLAFKGSWVVNGRATGIVVATGMATELGQVASLLQSQLSLTTPLQRRLAGFGRRLALLVLLICALIFLFGIGRGEAPVLMFLTAVSLAVAAIPEALPAVVTVALALGARRMVKVNALIRKLPAVETLGSVTCICSDKTGTLTENRMQVVKTHPAAPNASAAGLPRPDRSSSTLPHDAAMGADAVPPLILTLALNNDATLASTGTNESARNNASGDPMEIALLEAVQAAGWSVATLQQHWPRLAEWPFDATRKRMTTWHRCDASGEQWLLCKGAPESVLGCCALPADQVEAWLAAAQDMAADGLRVLAFAGRPLSAEEAQATLSSLPPAAAVEIGLQCFGLIGLQDPPRADVPAAIAECRRAGIQPRMITGDHPITARAIARQIGLLADSADADQTVLTGAALTAMSASERAAAIDRTLIFARVTPAQKIEIVQQLQASGQLVAMTGDGVNDAPALQGADIGVAMGLRGTDVAREAAHMVLLDDRFATIVAAVAEGRRIYDNIRKFVRFVMAGNTGEILLLLLAPLFGMPLPLLPIQILWVNLITDGLPGLAFAAEPAERHVMQRPPRPPSESLLARGLWQHVLWVGALIAGLSLLVQAYAGGSPAHQQTLVFTVLTLCQLWHAQAIRSEYDSLWRRGFTSNRSMLLAVLTALAMQFVVVHSAWGNRLFHTVPLTGAEWLLCIALSALIWLAIELEKRLRRRRP